MIDTDELAARDPYAALCRPADPSIVGAIDFGSLCARVVLDAIPAAVVVVSSDGRIERANRAAAEMFGYESAALDTQPAAVLLTLPALAEYKRLLADCLDDPAPHAVAARELNARRRDGSIVRVRLSLSVFDDGGRAIVFMQDLTVQRTLQEEILDIARLERQRIGQELHDSAQQELTGLGLLASNLSDRLRQRDCADEQRLASRIASGIAETNRHLRLLARGLEPVSVDAGGLFGALSSLAQDIEHGYGVACRFECPEPVRTEDEATAAHLYRIAHEAVMHAVTYADAGNIVIGLRQGSSTLRLSVTHNGQGAAGACSRQARLRLMEHRCALLGGSLSMRPDAGGGTMLACEVPCNATGSP